MCHEFNSWCEPSAVPWCPMMCLILSVSLDCFRWHHITPLSTSVYQLPDTLSGPFHICLLLMWNTLGSSGWLSDTPSTLPSSSSSASSSSLSLAALSHFPHSSSLFWQQPPENFSVRKLWSRWQRGSKSWHYNTAMFAVNLNVSDDISVSIFTFLKTTKSCCISFFYDSFLWGLIELKLV